MVSLYHRGGEYVSNHGYAKVDVIRGHVVESSHIVHVAVVDNDGTLLWSAGNPDRRTFARSAAKPFQAVPLITSGAAEAFHFDEADIALCAASHNGESEHADRVEALLRRIGCSVDNLVCGAHPPIHGPAYAALQEQGKAVSAIHNNCSGKHTGMLAVAKQLGASVSDYDSEEHPVQQAILKVVAEASGLAPSDIETAVDGCGVVVFGMPLRRLARAFAQLAKPTLVTDATKRAFSTISHAMMAHPHLVAGTGRMCTAFMTAMNGRAVAKAGAEGVYGIGLLESGYGVAIKVEDGADRAAPLIVVEVMRQLGLWTQAEQASLHAHYPFSIKNVRGDIVGELKGTLLFETPGV